MNVFRYVSLNYTDAPNSAIPKLAAISKLTRIALFFNGLHFTSIAFDKIHE